MARSLPPNPSLVTLKKQAKRLHRAHKEGDASCCQTLRLLRRFIGKSDEDILAAELKLTAAQYGLAMDYGFNSWTALKRHVMSVVGHDPRSFVKRENGRVWIENVPTLGWNIGKVTTYCGAMEATMALSEHPFSYDELMAYSGVAFRARWHNEGEQRRWCPSSVVAEQPDEMIAISRATGWSLPSDYQWDEDDPDKNRAADRSRAEIDAGRPVATYDDSLNVAVAYGYTEDNTAILLRTYGDEDAARIVPVEDLGPQHMYLGDHNDDSSLQDAARLGLALARDNWRMAKHVDGPAEYWYGSAAYDRWLKDLGIARDLNDEDKDALSWANIITFGWMCDARKAAIRFLRSQVDILNNRPGAAALARAADTYTQHVAICDTAMKEPSPDNDLGGAWYVPSVQFWLAHQVDRQRALLPKLKQLDDSAIADIEVALAAME